MGFRREFAILGTEMIYSFPCDKNGNINTNDKNFHKWRRNYEDCFLYPERFIDRGVVEDGKLFCMIDLPLQAKRMYMEKGA